MSIGYWTSLDPMDLILEAWDDFQDMDICKTTPSPAYLVMAPRGHGDLVVGWADEIHWVGEDMKQLDWEAREWRDD
jgi:hypothetical protein